MCKCREGHTKQALHEGVGRAGGGGVEYEYVYITRHIPVSTP